MTTKVGNVDDLLRRARCVLFDFDGPLCRLFAHHPADQAELRIRRLLKQQQGHVRLLGDMADVHGPHAILHRLSSSSPAAPADLLAMAETVITRVETEAVRSAVPTPYAGEVVSALAARGVRLAVTSNNSADAIGAYLRLHRLDGHFAGRVYGRSPTDPALMKPHPDCLERAIHALAVPASACMMLGDSRADVAAAGKAGVAFLGYARNERKATELRDAGATVLVGSLRYVLDAIAPQLVRH